MEKYEVEIKEELSRSVEIGAESLTDALEIAETKI